MAKYQKSKETGDILAQPDPNQKVPKSVPFSFKISVRKWTKFDKYGKSSLN
jgi:hypothetical protein